MGKLWLLLTTGLGLAGGFVAAKRLGSNGPTPQDFGFGSEPPARAPEQVQRVVHIARIRSGNEAQLRRLIEQRFPVAAMDVSGLSEIAVFIGSTYLITEYTFSGEYNRVFQAFRGQSAVTDYLHALGELLDDEPAPLPDEPAQQFLASQALHWDRSEGLIFTPRVRPREASTQRS